MHSYTCSMQKQLCCGVYCDRMRSPHCIPCLSLRWCSTVNDSDLADVWRFICANLLVGCFNFSPCSVAHLLLMPYHIQMFCFVCMVSLDLGFPSLHQSCMGLQFSHGGTLSSWRNPKPGVDPLMLEIPWNFMAKVTLKHFPQLELSKLRAFGGLDYTRFFLWHIKILHFEVQYWLDWLKNDPNALSKSTSYYSLLVISCVVG